MGLVHSFCCGCSLQQGTIVSGIVSTIRGLLNILAGCFVLVHLSSPRERAQVVLESVTSNLTIYEEKFTENDERFLVAASSTVIGIGLIVITVSALLFIGVSKRKPGYILPWIIWQSIEFFFATCCFILQHTIMNMGTKVLPDKGGGPFSIVLMVYLYIVVLSYYKSLQRPPQTEIPMAVRMTQINLNPTGYQNQPGYVVTLAGPVSPMAPMAGYDPRAPGMAYSVASYDPRNQAMAPMPGYSQGPPGMPLPAGFAPPLDAKSGFPVQHPQNPEYSLNPPPYSAPPPYSQV